MNLSDFYYYLPQEQIAQTPLADRSASRLMVIDRAQNTVEHHVFRDIIDYLIPGDCLVINNTKVIPARLIGEKEKTGGAVEILLLRRIDSNRWEALAGPGRAARKGQRLVFGGGLLHGQIEDVLPDGNRIIAFEYEGVFEVLLDRLGEMPLPPYIKEKLADRNRYQTVYAEHDGSAAAPTAGLHFTPELLEAIKAKGVNIAEVTLHVGLGTFRPVKVDDVETHKMHSEYYSIDQTAADIINNTKQNGGRVIAVGTTSCRTLESNTVNGKLQAGSGFTDIFIYPGYQFKMMDALITNFHLPESTLIMLVSAFWDREHILKAYKTAVNEGYRFFSFGDAMFIR